MDLWYVHLAHSTTRATQAWLLHPQYSVMHGVEVSSDAAKQVKEEAQDEARFDLGQGTERG